MTTVRLAPRHIRDDEEPEPETITVGWDLTNISHGYCTRCGWQGHYPENCPNLAPVDSTTSV